MQLPFTVEQFYGVFREYNNAVWPTQWFLFALAVAAVALIAFPRRWSGVSVSAILAFLWAWLGIAYHLTFFTAIAAAMVGFVLLVQMGELAYQRREGERIVEEQFYYDPAQRLPRRYPSAWAHPRLSAPEE